jgi:hypothetical protein
MRRRSCAGLCCAIRRKSLPTSARACRRVRWARTRRSCRCTRGRSPTYVCACMCLLVIRTHMLIIKSPCHTHMLIIKSERAEDGRHPSTSMFTISFSFSCCSGGGIGHRWLNLLTYQINQGNLNMSRERGPMNSVGLAFLAAPC